MFVRVSHEIKGKYYVYIWDGIARECRSPKYDAHNGGIRISNTQSNESISFVGRPYKKRNSAMRYASKLRSGK